MLLGVESGFPHRSAHLRSWIGDLPSRSDPRSRRSRPASTTRSRTCPDALGGTAPLLLGAAVNGTNSTDQFAYLGLFDETRGCPPGGGDAFGEFDGKGARYWDNVRSWPTVEPAIDFVATTPLAFALLIATA